MLQTEHGNAGIMHRWVVQMPIHRDVTAHIVVYGSETNRAASGDSDPSRDHNYEHHVFVIASPSALPDVRINCRRASTPTTPARPWRCLEDWRAGAGLQRPRQAQRPCHRQ